MMSHMYIWSVSTYVSPHQLECSYSWQLKGWLLWPTWPGIEVPSGSVKTALTAAQVPSSHSKGCSCNTNGHASFILHFKLGPSFLKTPDYCLMQLMVVLRKLYYDKFPCSVTSFGTEKNVSGSFGCSPSYCWAFLEWKATTA